MALYSIALGLPVAFLLGWLIPRSWQLARALRTARMEAEKLQQQYEQALQQQRDLELRCARLEEEKRLAVEKQGQLEEAEQRLGQNFKALSAEALARNNRAFLDLAQTSLERYQERAKRDLGQKQEAIDLLLKPVKESLTKFEGKLSELEKARVENTATLKQQLSALALMQGELQRETTRLSSALKTTTVRGRWGEIQLKRVVELAGMVAHCDFYEQESVMSEEGRRRPDLVVRLPTDRVIIVDAKAPLDAYLEASAAEEEADRCAHLKRHAEQIRLHIRALASKGYAEHFKPSPEFVVLFLPGEIFFSAALSQDPTLIELGAEKGVILATPTTLISLLRAVSYGWRQEAISEHAEKVSALGTELYKRLGTLSQHWGKVGKHLGTAVQAYNDAVGSLERRVIVTAREFEHLGVHKNNSELASPPTVDKLPRLSLEQG